MKHVYAIELALDWWIKNTPEASWKVLISSVDRCGEKDTADSMRKTLSKEGEQRIWASTPVLVLVLVCSKNISKALSVIFETALPKMCSTTQKCIVHVKW